MKVYPGSDIVNRAVDCCPAVALRIVRSDLRNGIFPGYRCGAWSRSGHWGIILLLTFIFLPLFSFSKFPYFLAFLLPAIQMDFYIFVDFLYFFFFLVIFFFFQYFLQLVAVI